MFPGANSTVYYNEDGEYIGHDNNYADEPDYYYAMDSEYGIDPLDFPEPECPNEDCEDDLCDGFCLDDDDYVAEDAWLDGSYEE